jgi:hypothetical protein
MPRRHRYYKSPWAAALAFILFAGITAYALGGGQNDSAAQPLGFVDVDGLGGKDPRVPMRSEMRGFMNAAWDQEPVGP